MIKSQNFKTLTRRNLHILHPFRADINTTNNNYWIICGLLFQKMPAKGLKESHLFTALVI